MSSVVVFLYLTTLLSIFPSLNQAQLTDWDKYRVVWSDDFDEFDGTKWTFQVTASGAGNNEFQLYTPNPENCYTTGGILYIKPTLLANSRNPSTGQAFGTAFMTNGVLNVTAMYGSCTDTNNNGCYRTGAAGNIPPVMSARLTSVQKFSFKYGRVSMSVKMPVGDWLWPAVWMLPEGKVYGDWPRSGEIDLIECKGNRNLLCGTELSGIHKMGATLHWGNNWDANRYYLTSKSKHDDNNNYGDNFHNIILDWNENGLSVYVDDQQKAVLTVPNPLIDNNPNWKNFYEWGKPWAIDTNPWEGASNMAPFDQNFNFLINVAVGGTNGYFSDNCSNQGGDANAQKPWKNSDGYTSSLQKFYNARANWLPTWDVEGNNNALQVDYIRVWKHI